MLAFTQTPHASVSLLHCHAITQRCALRAAAPRPSSLSRHGSTQRFITSQPSTQQNRCYCIRRASRRTCSVNVRAEQSYIMIKPDGVQRALVGEIIHRFERKGFTLKALKMFVPSKHLAEEHYKDLSAKPFFPKLVDYIISGPVVAMVSIELSNNGRCSFVHPASTQICSDTVTHMSKFYSAGLGRRWCGQVSAKADWRHKSAGSRSRHNPW